MPDIESLGFSYADFKGRSFMKLFLRIFISILAIHIGVLCSSLPAFAAKPKPKEISCPPYIGNTSDGAYVRNGVGRSPYKCYEKKKDVVRTGFMTQSELRDMNFHGWYRIRLTEASSTCADGPSSGPVLFGQIYQSNNAVFADFCPSLGRMAGAKTDDGISVSATTISTDSYNPLSCTAGQVESTQRFEMHPVLEKSSAYSTSLTITRRCVNPGEEDRVCVTTYSGPAFLETHPIWPPVAEKPTELEAGCSVALTKCADCHVGLTFPQF